MSFTSFTQGLGANNHLALSQKTCIFIYMSEAPINGINYVTDAHNKRLAGMIDLELHGELWEDVYDGLVARSRQEEESLSLEEVKNHAQASLLMYTIQFKRSVSHSNRSVPCHLYHRRRRVSDYDYHRATS